VLLSAPCLFVFAGLFSVVSFVLSCYLLRIALFFSKNNESYIL
jgi:hypothetical protein